MSRKYAALTACLEQQTANRLSLSFSAIEQILGFSLPSSAREHVPWWTNSRSPGRHNEAWLGIGWETTDLNMKAETIAFERSDESAPRQRLSRNRRSARAASITFAPSTLMETDLAANCVVNLQLRWRRLGVVSLEGDRKLAFLLAPVSAGLYRLIVRVRDGTAVYIGEAINLKRRFGNYRLPGKTQQTSLRINNLLIEALSSGGSVAVDIAYQNIGLNVGGVSIDADLSDKAVRRMIEQAAIVAHGGIDVEMLNR